MTDTKSVLEELEKQTKNQIKIIELLETLINVTAACAISDPSNCINGYARMDAAAYAKSMLDKKDKY